MIVDEIIAGYAAVVATAVAIIPVRQARGARKPQIELALVHTWYEEVNKENGDRERRKMITLEARNRGDHPIRIIGARIASEKFTFQFIPHGITATHKGPPKSYTLQTMSDQEALDKLAIAPLPGIILPQDAASRFITDDISTTFLAIQILEAQEAILKAQEAKKPEIEVEFARDAANAFDAELRSWVEVTTGEYLESKPVSWDWDAAWRKTEQASD